LGHDSHFDVAFEALSEVVENLVAFAAQVQLLSIRMVRSDSRRWVRQEEQIRKA
jgi:hypothetical protein